MRRHPTTAQINPTYQKAYAGLYGDTEDAERAAAALSIERHHGGRQWIIIGQGLRLHHWPSTGRWMPLEANGDTPVSRCRS
ncbi:MAG TPA: hypothetical protein VKB96_03000 [Gammaproteobacteria bacterium]|nr:hypothetical protein [Gammaproteobacteria bacterium]